MQETTAFDEAVEEVEIRGRVETLLQQGRRRATVHIPPSNMGQGLLAQEAASAFCR